MPKKLKLNLSDLKVQSFVTSLNKEDKQNIKGGTDPVACSLTLIWCCAYTPVSCETCETCETCKTCETCHTCFQISICDLPCTRPGQIICDPLPPY
jgi:hypothetical protein